MYIYITSYMYTYIHTYKYIHIYIYTYRHIDIADPKPYRATAEQLAAWHFLWFESTAPVRRCALQ
jgi:hypothetical protein